MIKGGIRWFFYSLVIMFLGGIIVVFVYASSLGNNFILLIKSNYLNFVLAIAVATLTLINEAQPNFMIYSAPSIIYSEDISGPIILIGLILLSVLFVVAKTVKVEDGAIKL